MAKLKAENFELDFLYHNFNCCDEVEYSFSIALNGKPFINPDIISQGSYAVKNGKFIFSDCWEKEDWLLKFFTNILTTKKGGCYETTEPPIWAFKAITWEDRREEQEKKWEGKTVKTKMENGEIIDVPYIESMKMFTPLWENDINFKIDFPHEILDTEEYTTFELSLTTTFNHLKDFIEELSNEMKQFFRFFGDRIEYIGNGKYQEKEDFRNKFSPLDKNIYLEKKCAEWNNENIIPDSEILLELILKDFGWRSYRLVGTARYILESSVSKYLAKETFVLAETKLQDENDQEIVKALQATKTAIAIVFPNSLTNAQLSDALTNVKVEDIPDEIFHTNETIYLQYLQNHA